MSSSEAQKSPVHNATEDAASEPTHAAGGDADKDRRKLSPDAAGQSDARGRAEPDETAVGKDPDESSYGGRLNLDDPKAV